MWITQVQVGYQYSIASSTVLTTSFALPEPRVCGTVYHRHWHRLIEPDKHPGVSLHRSIEVSLNKTEYIFGLDDTQIY